LNEGENYQKPMVNFLNSYMGKNKDLGDKDAAAMTNSFCSAIDLLLHSIGNRAFRPARALNAAVFDSVMVGTARRLGACPTIKKSPRSTATSCGRNVLGQLHAASKSISRTGS